MNMPMLCFTQLSFCNKTIYKSHTCAQTMQTLDELMFEGNTWSSRLFSFRFYNIFLIIFI